MLEDLLNLRRRLTIARHREAPLLKEREKFLEHLHSQGTSLAALRSRAGEAMPFPPPFEEAIRKITAVACCVGCKHTHVGVPPVVVNHVTNKGQLA